MGARGERRGRGVNDEVYVRTACRKLDHGLRQFDGRAAPVLHLPVARDERPPAGVQVASPVRRTSMPGSFLPSMSSRDAPPPVEMCFIFLATPSPAACTAAALSPPPTTVNAGESAIAWATPNVPAAKGAFSNRPMGPFQKMVFAPANRCANACTLFGPMSSANVAAGTESTPTTSPLLA